MRMDVGPRGTDVAVAAAVPAAVGSRPRRGRPRHRFDRVAPPPVAGALITASDVHASMPKTLEVKCPDSKCDLDMMELHYTYGMPDGTGAEAFSCPYCGGDVEEISV